MQTDIVAYDYSAVILLMITVFYYFRRRMHRTYRGLILIAIVAFTNIAAVCDATRVRFAGMDTVTELRFFNANFAYYLFVALIPPLFLLYVIADTGLWHKISGFRFRVVACSLPVVFYIVIIVVNFFVPVVFETGPGKELIKHWGYYLGNINLVFYIFLSILFLYRYVSSISRRRFLILLTPVVIVSAGMLVMLVWPEHHVGMFAISVSILVLVLIYRRVEDSADYVTGMYSYKVFVEDMRTNFRSRKRMDIILMNITNYKYAQRLVGYDVMLRMMGPVADEIFRTLRRYRAQFMCYYNGEGKFAIELSGRQLSNASEIANELSRSIHQAVRMDVADFELETTTCLACCPDDISDMDSLFMLISDIDLAETDGRIVSASHITGTREFEMKREMATIIDRALANHYFSVFYQPIYDIREKRFASAEALVRLRDPRFGYISPSLFIPLAEKNGAIHAIGSFVLEEVVKFIASDDFKPLGVDYIEINLSAMQCLRSDLADEIIDLCTRYGVDPQKINLEITETASAYSQSKLYGNISILADHGFSFSLDDFGTGYSNLMRIASLPLDIVKLDRAFVLMEEGGGHHVIIRNLIEMLKNMDLKVVVEGIETEEMAQSFIQMGVDEIQGFFYSRPLTKSAYIRFVREKMTA